MTRSATQQVTFNSERIPRIDLLHLTQDGLRFALANIDTRQDIPFLRYGYTGALSGRLAVVGDDGIICSTGLIPPLVLCTPGQETAGEARLRHALGEAAQANQGYGHLGVVGFDETTWYRLEPDTQQPNRHVELEVLADNPTHCFVRDAARQIDDHGLRVLIGNQIIASLGHWHSCIETDGNVLLFSGPLACIPCGNAMLDSDEIQIGTARGSGLANDVDRITTAYYAALDGDRLDAYQALRAAGMTPADAESGATLLAAT